MATFFMEIRYMEAKLLERERERERNGKGEKERGGMKVIEQNSAMEWGGERDRERDSWSEGQIEKERKVERKKKGEKERERN